MKLTILTMSCLLGFSLSTTAAENAVSGLLKQYQSDGVNQFNAEKGKQLWQQKHLNSKKQQQRSCQDCHGSDLSQSGKHIRTGKLIKPMAPSANSKRLTDSKKIEKWFKRNCKWTFGRICTAQEKAHFLTFLQGQ